MQTLRALVIVTFACVLAACAAQAVAPLGPGATATRIAARFFVTFDGQQLPMRQWLPEGKPQAVVLAAHGFNDYSKAFDKVPGTPGVGPYLAARGIAVYAYDQRGFGVSPNPGIWPGHELMAGDFADFAKVLKAQYPDVPLYGMGESMGGAVAIAALTSANPPPLDGVVLVAPAVWARTTMPMLYRVTLWLGAHIVPGWRPTGQSLGRMASDNIDMLRDNSRDPLFIKKTRVDAVYGLSALMDAAYAGAAQVKVPVLYLYGHYDQIIPKKPTKLALTAMEAAGRDVRLAYYAKGYHMLMRDQQAATVLEDIAAFLRYARAPLPSGADKNAVARLAAAKNACPPCD